MPPSRIPDGSRTPVGVPQGGRTPAWGMASGSRSKRRPCMVECQRTNIVKLRHTEARQLERPLGSRMARPGDAPLLTEVVVVPQSIHTTAHERRTEVSQAV